MRNRSRIYKHDYRYCFYPTPPYRDSSGAGRARSGRKGVAMFRLLMLPANAVCDALGMVDENERGMVRMLVNTTLWTTIGAVIWLLAWVFIVHAP